ncbi:MAG: DUF4340 domain-containing protein [Deltaproteobacteria bacterium]|nr:DUF4340 domain-containing protein [Deltaproteobacteria bacterium]
MTPRRVLPYLALFLVLVGVYLGLNWQRERREAQEQEAKKLFPVKEAEVVEFAVIKGKDEIRLVKKDQEWRLSRPLEIRADQDAVKSVLLTLGHLQKMRDLGAATDLKPFGLDQPAAVVEFTVQGKAHRLAIGAQAPDALSYYALKDQDPQVLLISAGDKDSLDRPLAALRHKTLLTFTPEQVKAVKIKTGKTVINLERTGPQTWRWLGREQLPLRSDRVEALLRQLKNARVKEFISDAPKELKPFGLAPQAAWGITLITDQGQQTLDLGTRSPQGTYARLVPHGVVAIDSTLAENLTKTGTQLEDRRLWGGPASEAHKVVWGTPEKLWTGVKEKESWKLTGPEKQELSQPAVRLESALGRLAQVEYHKSLPAPSPGKKESYRVEIYDGADKLLLGLEDRGQTGNQVEMRTRRGDKTQVYLVPLKTYRDWQEDMNRLTASPPKEKSKK